MQDAARGGLERRASRAGLPSAEAPSVPPACTVGCPPWMELQSPGLAGVGTDYPEGGTSIKRLLRS